MSQTRIVKRSFSKCSCGLAITRFFSLAEAHNALINCAKAIMSLLCSARNQGNSMPFSDTLMGKY
jgi:hypothetical protein